MYMLFSATCIIFNLYMGYLKEMVQQNMNNINFDTIFYDVFYNEIILIV